MNSNPPLDLSIVVPAYNEEGRIAPTLQAMRRWLDQSGLNGEIVVVDDGSRDRTVEVARDTDPRCRIHSCNANQGKGGAVRAGALKADGAKILFADADNSTPIEEFEHFLPRFEQGADVVIGSRGLPESRIEIRQNPLRENAGRAFNRALRLITGLPFRDTQCGFKAFRRDAAREIFSRQRVTGWAFDVELLTIAKRQGYKVDEVPVRWLNSPDSRVSLMRDAPKMLIEVLRVRMNDMKGRYK